MTLWGLDLGGTKIEGAILDPERPDKALHRLRIETEAAKGYEHIVSRISHLVSRLEEESATSRPPSIGFGTPGTTEPTNGFLKNSNTQCLNGRPLGADLSRVLGVQAVLANDANCFALAEATLGAGKNAGVVMGLILGTGVGGGVVVNGKVVGGCHGIAGEWGHNTMRNEETPCYCGKRGCNETVFSGPALERYFFERTGESVRLPEILKRASSGDPDSQATLDRLRDKFGEAIAAIINVLDPDAIVIGGGVGNLDLLYSQETREAALKYVFNSELHTPFLRPTLGDSAGVFGAALLTV